MKTSERNRLRNYSQGTLHKADGLLFWSTCNVVLDHTRKSSIDKHLKSATHVQRPSSSETTGKQQTLKTPLDCKSWQNCRPFSLKTFVKSAQNRSLSSEICPKIPAKSAVFLPIVFRRNLPQKFPQIFHEIGPFFPRICL